MYKIYIYGSVAVLCIKGLKHTTVQMKTKVCASLCSFPHIRSRAALLPPVSPRQMRPEVVSKGVKTDIQKKTYKLPT